MALFEANLALEDRAEFMLCKFKDKVLDESVWHFAQPALRPQDWAGVQEEPRLLERDLQVVLLLSRESHKG